MEAEKQSSGNAEELVREAAVEAGPDGVGVEAASDEALASDVVVSEETAEGDAETVGDLPSEAVASVENGEDVEGVPDEDASEANSDDAAEAADAPAPDQATPEEVAISEVFDIDDGAFVEQSERIDTRRNDFKAILEAVIYITDEPLTPLQISQALNRPIDEVKAVLEELAAEYSRPDRGLTVREVAGGYKMATKPEHHEAVRAFVKSLKPPLKLSLAALETLAVIAYKQPATGPEIMEIRGVQGLGVLKTLMDRKLIATAGRKNVVGKPILYKTTKEFLVQFGLKDLSELPTLKEFEELGRFALSEAEPDAPTPVEEDPIPAPQPEQDPQPQQDPITEPPPEPGPGKTPHPEEPPPIKAEDGEEGAEAVEPAVEQNG